MMAYIYDDAKEKGNVNLKIDITQIIIETITPKSDSPSPYLYKRTQVKKRTLDTDGRTKREDLKYCMICLMEPKFEQRFGY